ncbi:uncharacterized protein [Periplaneta americana]|uniref:uncharacterized protein isoform X2 n=1 Tax=Periplaneta americana TaxID=6978 RepID=UPI0037E7F83F
MSRSKQEALLLEERIEKIRKKNEEIKRRHLEVEADKQNAAKLNALVQISSPIQEDWPVGGRSSPPREKNRRYQQNNRNNSHVTRNPSHGEGDVPPPDPAYKFLADSDRDVQHYSQHHNHHHHQQQQQQQQQQQRKGRGGGRGRGGFSRGRDRGGYHQYGGGGDVPRPEYEAWRAERNRIDNDRINRQKTAEGHWRREWDNEKITQEEDDRPITRVPRGGGPRKNTDWNSYHNYNTPPQEHDVDQVEEDNLPIRSERNVVSVGESIKISVTNDSPATVPVRRVKVNAPIVGGTGRVGPRQKIRISYSSQSEDETHQLPNRTSSTTSAHPDTDSASTKPPLPPSTGFNPKPKRQRVRRSENDIKQRKRELSANKDNEVNECQKDTESGGDDSWEDVTTTSGNESTCEELSPRSQAETKQELGNAVQEPVNSHCDESDNSVFHDAPEESLDSKGIGQKESEVQMQNNVLASTENVVSISEDKQKIEIGNVPVSKTPCVELKEDIVNSDVSSCLMKQEIEAAHISETSFVDSKEEAVHLDVPDSASPCVEGQEEAVTSNTLASTVIEKSKEAVSSDVSISTKLSAQEKEKATTTDAPVSSTLSAEEKEKKEKGPTMDISIPNACEQKQESA